MNRIAISMLGVALSGVVVAQTVDDSTDFDNNAPETVAPVPDSARYATFGVMESGPPSAVGRARGERASERSSGSAASSERKSSASRSGKGLSRTKDGPTVSVVRAMDPEGRKHWARSNRRSTRQTKSSPPGTVQ